jgi:hypothetical protein
MHSTFVDMHVDLIVRFFLWRVVFGSGMQGLYSGKWGYREAYNMSVVLLVRALASYPDLSHFIFFHILVLYHEAQDP